MDEYKKHPEDISLKSKAEKYAKIIGKTLIFSDGDAAAYGQNAFFYDAAEGLITAVILLIAEFAPPEQRHIVSVSIVRQMIECIKVFKDGKLLVIFGGGYEVEVLLQDTE